MENVHVLYLSKYIHVAREMQKLPLKLITMPNDVRAKNNAFKWHKISKRKRQRNEPERPKRNHNTTKNIEREWREKNGRNQKLSIVLKIIQIYFAIHVIFIINIRIIFSFSKLSFGSVHCRVPTIDWLNWRTNVSNE